MIGKLVPNQKAIRVKKETSNSEHIFGIFNRNATQKALKELKPSAFKLWAWINLNQDNYEFGLSNKVIKDECGLGKDAYNSAVKELIEKGFLVERELYPNLQGYIFSEGASLPAVVGKSDNEKIDNKSLSGNPTTVVGKSDNAVVGKSDNSCRKIQQEILQDTTNNNTDRLQEQSIVLSERLEAIANQFSNGEAARKSFKQLLDSGKTEDWIVAAVNNNFPQETNNFPQETIVSHSTEEIDNNNNNNKIDSLEPTIVFSERLEKLAQQFTFVGARFNSTIIE